MPVKNTDINVFEAQLQAAMRPVHLRSEALKTMRRRINFKAPVEMAERLSNQPSLLLILGGVLSASLLIITAARAIFYLTNRTKI